MACLIIPLLKDIWVIFWVFVIANNTLINILEDFLLCACRSVFPT